MKKWFGGVLSSKVTPDLATTASETGVKPVAPRPQAAMEAIALLEGNGLDAAALFVAAHLCHEAPRNGGAWFEAGRLLLSRGRRQEDESMMQLGMSCLKRAFGENMQERPGYEDLDLVLLAAGLSREPFRASRSLPGNILEHIEDYLSDAESVTREISVLSERDRTAIVIRLAESRIAGLAAIMAYALAADPGRHVRMAACKRMAWYAQFPEVKAAFESLVETGGWEEAEPYFSFALFDIPERWAEDLYFQVKPKIEGAILITSER